MARSRWKFLFYTNRLWHLSLRKLIIKNKSIIKKYTSKDKSSNIPKTLLYTSAVLDKGNLILKKKINKLMIGRKFGEFVFTKKPFYFPIKKAKKKKR